MVSIRHLPIGLPLVGFFVALLAPSAAFSQQQQVVMNPTGLPVDTRPFGKYLVEICPLRGDATFECTPPESAPGREMSQTITIKQVGCADTSSNCSVVYPLTEGADFYISAVSDSGLPVTQTVISGNATRGPAAGAIQKYTVAGPGTIVIQATQNGSGPTPAGSLGYSSAIPLRLTLTVGSGGDGSSPTCNGLLSAPSATSLSAHVAASDLITLVGSPTPFVLMAQGNDTILIYSTRYPNNENENGVLLMLIRQIRETAFRSPAALGFSSAATPFKIELTIPHAAVLGDLTTRINGLNYSGFTVQDIGSDKVLITAKNMPDCATWSAFLASIRHMEWQFTPEPLDTKLFYLTANDATTAFTGLASAGGSSTTTNTPASTTSGTGTPSSTPSATNSSATNATISVTQPPGSAIQISSDTTPCVVAGLATGNSSACVPSSGSGSGSGSNGSSGSGSSGSGSSGSSSSAAKPIGMNSMGVASGSSGEALSDLLVFSDSTPGDDAQVLERKRILAQLDLPRPEMIINAWIMQNSSSNGDTLGKFSNTVRGMVYGYNNVIEQLVLEGWKSVSAQTKMPGYFQEDFYHYVSDRYVADAPSVSSSLKAQDAAQRILDTSPAAIADSATVRQDTFGICPANRYCLGYNSLFSPLKPRLPDFLLTLVAAADAPKATTKAIADVEGYFTDLAVVGAPAPRLLSISTIADCRLGRAAEEAERCIAILKNLGPNGVNTTKSQLPCFSDDYSMMLGSLGPVSSIPGIFLRCFSQESDRLMRAAGLLRSALADFLFNYKMSQQYPHEFVPYDLSQSADALNSALSPLIDAFNRDIVAYQTFMRADMEYQVERFNRSSDQRCCVKQLFGLDKPSFFNDGLITVHTISGQQTTVNTTSQSSLDASTAPTLANLANALAGTATPSGTSPLAGVLGTAQAKASLLSSVLNAYQTTTAQIGRALNLTVTPRSLSTASSAEINIMLNADDSANSPSYVGGPQGSAPATSNTSRVSSHDTTTRIRVDSVKIFEVSSFSAILERSRSRFPLLPPFVEIPYIGTVAGIPIPPAKEYHNSTALLSAMVVPTAADIAYGLRFSLDQVVDGGGTSGKCSIVKGSAGADGPAACVFRRAVSLQDLNKSPVSAFHKSMIRCLSTDMTGANPGISSLANTNTDACKSLSFDSVTQQAY